MQLRSGEKKAIAIIVVVAVLFVAVVGGTVAALTVGRHHDEGPYLQLAVGDRLVRVEPSIRCDVFGNNCEPKDLSQATFGHVPVPVGESVLMSVSADIARQPWTLVTQYADARGVITDPDPEPVYKKSGATYTVTLPSTHDHVLVKIEVKVISAQTTATALPFRAVFAVDTTPEGFELVGPPVA
ncbi:DUF2771 family protein [Gordonia sp. NPDC003429]